VVEGVLARERLLDQLVSRKVISPVRPNVAPLINPNSNPLTIVKFKSKRCPRATPTITPATVPNNVPSKSPPTPRVSKSRNFSSNGASRAPSHLEHESAKDNQRPRPLPRPRAIADILNTITLSDDARPRVRIGVEPKPINRTVANAVPTNRVRRIHTSKLLTEARASCLWGSETPAHVMRRADIRGGGRRRGRVALSCAIRSSRGGGVAVRELPVPGCGVDGDRCSGTGTRGARLRRAVG
jgi:hypothetical protein